MLLPTFKASNAAADPPSCSPGAHSLSKFGDRVYPEMGNGGYTSLHTDLYLNYDAIANLFLPGTHADLQVKSTQCLSDLSFDFEQTNGHTADGTGPNMTVSSVEVNGPPAIVHGSSSRRTRATRTARTTPTRPRTPCRTSNPVSATNPNPPACSPQVSNNTQNGTQCPANKLVVTPVGADPGRDDVHGDDQLHGPPRRAHRRRRLDRGLVPHLDRRQRGLPSSRPSRSATTRGCR